MQKYNFLTNKKPSNSYKKNTIFAALKFEPMKKLFLLIINILLISFYCNAAYLTSIPRTVVQPNGDTLHCFITGDEFHHWLHDKDGYTIMQDPSTGYYVYATSDGTSLIPTTYIAGNVNPATVGLTPHQNITAERWQALRKQMQAYATIDEPAYKGEKNHGVFNDIVIFINFKGEDDFNAKFSEINQMCNDSTPDAVSMYNFFKQMSFNQLSLPSYFFPAPEGDIIKCYVDEHPRGYYLSYSVKNVIGYQNETERAEREHTLLKNALKYIEPMIPADLILDANEDNRVDNVCFIVKGEVSDWNSLLWPHKWSLPGEVTLHGKQVSTYNFQLEGSPGYFNTSVLCHEMFHTLGAPDLYHYDNATNLSPVGAWDLMCNNTNPPQQTSAYMKHKYGHWIDNIPTITSDGEYVLYPGNSNRADKMCYKIETSRPDEFFIVEYRRQSYPNDNTIYGSGLLVYRVLAHSNGNANYNGENSFDELYLFRPQGTIKANGDLTHAHFDAREGRDHIDINTDPFPYFHDGQVDSSFQITYISEPGDSLVFRIGNYFAFCAQNELTFEKEASSTQVQLTSNTSWKISSDSEIPDWLEITPTSGEGDTVLTISTLSQNIATENREFTFKITGDSIIKPQTIHILQKGTESFLEFSADTLIFDQDHLSHTIYVKTNTYWGISSSIEKEFPWLTINKEYGTGNDTIILTIKNISKFNREGTIYLKGGTGDRYELFVKQPGIIPILSVEADSNMMTKSTIKVENKVYTFKAKVHANMNWEIKTQNITKNPWFTISPTKGTGDQEITISILDTNSAVANRSCQLTLKGEEDQAVYYDMAQKGIPFQVSVDSNIIELGNILGTITLNVKANAGWNAFSNTSWYNASGYSSSGDSIITIKLNAFNYTNAKRSDTLFIRCAVNHEAKPFPILITQDTAYIYPSKELLLVENLAGASAKLTLKSNTRWYLTNMCNWVSASKSYGTNDLEITLYAKTTTTEERSCEIKITDRKGINKTVIFKQLTSVGVKDFSADKISVYPNPAQDMLNIYNQQIIINQVSVYDMQGREVLRKDNVGDFATTLNVASIAPGLYVVKIIGEGQTATKRIVIQ